MYREQHSSSRLLAGLAFVALLHVGVIVAFKNGLMRDFAPVLPQAIQAIFIEEQVQPTEIPKVEPMKQVEQVDPVIQPPDIVIPDVPDQIEMPVQIEPQATTQETTGQGEGPAVSEFKVDTRYPLSKPNYPPQSVRLQEEGVVTLMIYVLPNGRVGQAKIAQSSGFPRLDESAMREAMRSWRFVPRKVGNEAVASWGTFKVRFKLDQA